MLNGADIKLALSAIGLAEKGYKYSSQLLNMYKGNKEEFKILTSMTYDVLDIFADDTLTGVWDLGQWDYETLDGEDWIRAPWHVNGQLFVYYKNPKEKADTWKGALLLNYVYNKRFLRSVPNFLRLKYTKDFQAIFSLEILRDGRSNKKFVAFTTLKFKNPKTDDHVYTGQMNVELINGQLSGEFYNKDKIKEPIDKTARALVSFQNRSRWSSFSIE